jgi:HEAT repeat protein
MLSQVAPAILARATAVPPTSRGPFVSALASFGLEAGALSGLILETDPALRDTAVRLMWEAGGHEAEAPLRRFLDDPSGPVRRAVLEVLGESGAEDARRLALEVLEVDPSASVRLAALDLLTAAPASVRLAALQRAAKDPDAGVRAAAVNQLSRGLGAGADLLLLEALGDQEAAVWRAAQRHLAEPERGTEAAWTALERCSEPRRSELVALLERRQPGRLERLALAHLRASDVEERALAVGLAVRAATPRCTQGLLEALDDPSVGVRRAAARGLASLPRPGLAATVAEAMSDPDPGVRIELVRVLGAIDDRDALEHLVNALGDPDTGVREAAVEAMRSIRVAGATVDLIVGAVLDEEARAGARAGSLLDRLVGLERLVERLSSLDPGERLRSVDAVAAVGGPRAVEALVGVLRDPAPEVRERALTRLGDLGDPRAREAVERTLRVDPVREVAVRAEETLGRLTAEG